MTPVARVLRRAQRSGELPGALGGMPVRVAPPPGWGRADTAIHEAAHLTVALALGMGGGLGVVVADGDGVAVFDHAGAGADEVGVVSLAGASACGWGWIGIGDALLCEHALAHLGRVVSPHVAHVRGTYPASLLPCPSTDPRPGDAASDVDAWRRRAAMILSRHALLHARISIAIVARGGSIGRREIAALAREEGLTSRPGGPLTSMWDRAEREAGSLVDAVSALVTMIATRVDAHREGRHEEEA